MAKPVYDQAQVIAALTTADGTIDSRAWGRDQISYSLSSPVIAEGEPWYSPYYAGYVALTPTMEARAREAFALWDDLIDVELIELPELAEQEEDLRANVLFNGSTNTEDGLTYTLITYIDEPSPPRSTDTIVDTEVWLAAADPALDQDSDFDLGDIGFLIYLHQIGHALGLTHGGPYNIGPDYETDATHHQDTRQYTVLSPFEATANGSDTDHAGAYAATPLLHDILAVQAVYGADMTTRTGDTTYGFNATAGRDAFDFTRNTRPVVAIWDAGGTDTLDVSGFDQAQAIDLNEGAFSSIGGLTNNVAIAFGAAIENAVGGGGDDLITGTAAANRLEGGDGSDALFGGEGDDRLDGGTGDDNLTGGDGADALIGGPGDDTALYVAAAAGVRVDFNRPNLNDGVATGDTHSGIENIVGSSFDDRLAGNAVSNAIRGRDGNDWLEGRRGADTLAGGRGHDRLDGGPGDDWLAGGPGDDDLTGGPGADALFGGPGDDTAFYAAAAAGVRVDFNRPHVNGGVATGDTHRGIENVAGSNFDDRLAGNAVSNAIWGHDGNDRLEGRRGADTLDGGTGDDDLTGGPGADRFIFTDGHDRDTVGDFARGADTLVLDRDLWGGTDLSAQQVVDLYATLAGDAVIFDFGGGDSITLLDVGTLALAGDLQLV